MFSNKPYDFPYWNRGEFYLSLKLQASKLGLSKELECLLIEAVYDRDWEPKKDFDGCTMVPDDYHPCMWCFIHDWLWVTGQGGLLADNLMFKLAYRTKTFSFSKKKGMLVYLKKSLIFLYTAFLYIFVRGAWLFFFKWQKILKKKRQPVKRIVTNTYKNIKLWQ